MRAIGVAARIRHLAIADRLLAIAVIEIPHHAVLVVHRHPVMAVDLLLARARRAKLRERHDEVIAADIELLAERPDAVIAIAVIGEIDLERRRAALNADIVGRDAGLLRILLQRAMQDGEMRGVDAAFERLQPVALLHHLADGAMRLGATASIRISAAPAASRAGPYRPRSTPLISIGRIGGRLDLRRRIGAARSSDRRIARRCRISSRDRRSAARSPRCGRATARRGDAGRIPRSSRSGRPSCGRRRASSPSSRTRTGGQSGSGNSQDNSAGIQ